MKHKLTATEDFPYDGRQLKAGESFYAVNERDAQLLVGIGKARLENEEDYQVEDEHHEVKEQSNRRYRRRDMQAERNHK